MGDNDSNVSVDISLKNQAMNYQNDSMFHDKDYKRDAKKLYAID